MEFNEHEIFQSLKKYVVNSLTAKEERFHERKGDNAIILQTKILLRHL